MKANGFQPSIPSPSAERLAELESSLEQARAETDELRAKVVELESKAEAAANAEREMVKRDRKWEKELAKTVAAKDEEAAKSMATLKLERECQARSANCCAYLSASRFKVAAKVNELQTARQELAAEVEHSKSLQAKVKNSVAAPSSSATAGSDSKLAKLTEEYRRLEMHRNLGEDLTGFAVVSNKSEDAGEVYNCILNDCLGVVGGEFGNGAICGDRAMDADDCCYCRPQLQADVPPRRDGQLRSRRGCRARPGTSPIAAPGNAAIHAVSARSSFILSFSTPH